MDWNVLFGWICTLIGGVFGAWLIIWSEQERSVETTKRRERIILAGLLAELTDNKEIAGVGERREIFSFVTDMWDVYKGEATFLGQETHEIVRNAYCLIHQANDKGENAKVFAEKSQITSAAEKQSRFIQEKNLMGVLEKAIQKLTEYETEV